MVYGLCTTRKFKKQGGKHLDVAYTWHMDSRWYISDLHVVTTDILAFVSVWHQVLYSGLEEFSVRCL
jgi:hypothetical protein